MSDTTTKLVLDNRYRLLEPLGSGGMGTVYFAEHVLLGERVAVKVLHPRFASDQEWVRRFLLEARASLRVRHDNVVRVIDFATPSPGVVYMVMEHIAGESLHATLKRDGSLPWRRALHMVDQIAAALAAAHVCGIVHRDIKPSNCIRTPIAGDPDGVKVLDFGIAKFLEPVGDGVSAPHTATGMWMGTAEYMSPEMYRNEPVDPRADVYALGVLMYRMLTGVVPFPGNHMEVAAALMTRDATPPSTAASAANLPPAVDILVLRAVARRAEERTPSMVALRAEIAAALAEADEEPATPTMVFKALDLSRAVGRASAAGVASEGPPTATVAAAALAERVTAVTPQRGRARFATGLVALVGVLGVAVALASRTNDSPTPAEATTVLTGPPVAEPSAPAVDDVEPPELVAADQPGAPVVSQTPDEPAVAQPDAPTSAVMSVEATSTARDRPRKRATAKPHKMVDVPDVLPKKTLDAELASLQGKVVDSCFRPNRVAAGARFVLDVTVDGAGKAAARLVDTPSGIAAECVLYWVRRRTFSVSWSGGATRFTFVAG